jgi:hypothetical protein
MILERFEKRFFVCFPCFFCMRARIKMIRSIVYSAVKCIVLSNGTVPKQARSPYFVLQGLRMFDV